MKIRNPYYIIWVDLIIHSRKNHPELTENRLRFNQLFLISLVLSSNFEALMCWLRYFDIINIPILKIDFTPIDSINSPLSFCIQFLIPSFIINYYFIYYNSPLDL